MLRMPPSPGGGRSGATAGRKAEGQGSRGSHMIISNINFVNPIKETEIKCDIEISDGRICALAEPGSLSDDGDGFIDGTGLNCAPGFMDVHSHFRDPGFTHKEDILSGARAAARGGFTDIVLMANTNPPVDNVETLAYVLGKGLSTGIHISSCATVTKGLKGEELVDFEELKKHGAAGFTDDGIPIMNEYLLRDAMIKCRELDVPISLHEEDKALISENGINAGIVSSHYGLMGSPREAEITMVKRDIELARETGVKLIIQHVSTKETVELVRKARAEGYTNIYAEVTPHHFSLTDDAVIQYGSNAKMNPPLRSEEDRLAIIEGLKDGSVSYISTDHAPHALEEKNLPLTKAPSGITGLETAFSLGLEYLVKPGHISLYKLLRLMSTEPGAIYSRPCPGLNTWDPADLVLFTTEEKWIYDNTLSKSFNSPFKNREMTGKIKYTICGGRIVYEDL